MVLSSSSSSSLVASGPNKGTASSFEPLLFFLDPSGVYLSVVGCLLVLCCAPREVFSSPSQICLSIDYSIQLLPDFFGVANNHTLRLPLFSLVDLWLDEFYPSSLAVIFYWCP